MKVDFQLQLHNLKVALSQARKIMHVSSLTSISIEVAECEKKEEPGLAWGHRD